MRRFLVLFGALLTTAPFAANADPIVWDTSGSRSGFFGLPITLGSVANKFSLAESVVLTSIELDVINFGNAPLSTHSWAFFQDGPLAMPDTNFPNTTPGDLIAFGTESTEVIDTGLDIHRPLDSFDVFTVVIDIAPLEIASGDYWFAALEGESGEPDTNPHRTLWLAGNGTIDIPYFGTRDISNPMFGRVLVQAQSLRLFGETVTSVPEPSTLALFGLALAGIVFAKQSSPPRKRD